MLGLAVVFSTTVMSVYLAVVILYFSIDLVDYCCWDPYTIRIWVTLRELAVLILRSE